jgi:hypothetical protein
VRVFYVRAFAVCASEIAVCARVGGYSAISKREYHFVASCSMGPASKA